LIPEFPCFFVRNKANIEQVLEMSWSIKIHKLSLSLVDGANKLLFFFNFSMGCAGLFSLVNFL
jgi:hypothetical protein